MIASGPASESCTMGVLQDDQLLIISQRSAIFIIASEGLTQSYSYIWITGPF